MRLLKYYSHFLRVNRILLILLKRCEIFNRRDISEIGETLFLVVRGKLSLEGVLSYILHTCDGSSCEFLIMYLRQSIGAWGMRRGTCLLCGSLRTSHGSVASAQSGILNTSIKKPFGRILCHMMRLLLELRGLADWNRSLIQIILKLDMRNQICWFLQIFSISTVLFLEILKFPGINGAFTISESI